MDINSVFMRNCLKIVNNFYNELSFEEIHTFFESCEPQNLMFNAPLGNASEYYYSINASVDIMNNLLLFQYEQNAKNVKSFLKELLNVIDKRVPKKNTMFVLSAPNAGKNFFFDAVIHYFINFGQMGNFNRYCNFPMQECVDRRIILWNEPVLEASACETLKMILGGDTVNAKVKYSPDMVVTRTPVIVLSNTDVFPNDQAFRSRMYTHKWKPAKMLKKCDKKPHPLAVYHLFKMYE